MSSTEIGFPEATNVPANIQAAALEALASNTRRQRPAQRSAVSFADATTELVDQTGKNKYPLLCPKPECGSIILSASVATLEQDKIAVLEPADQLPPSPLPKLDGSKGSSWWLITGSPMVFENIGFSKTLDPDPTGGSRKKLLACAECDLGPLGYCILGGNDHWLALDRVGYRADA